MKRKKNTWRCYPLLLMCTINDNHAMYGSWIMEHECQNVFVILGHFLHFYPPNNLENQYLEKIEKKNPGDIINLHMCTINGNHMMYGSWDMEHNCQNFLSFWTIFCTFNPFNNPKNQNFEKMKKNAWRYHHFTYVYQKL